MAKDYSLLALVPSAITLENLYFYLYNYTQNKAKCKENLRFSALNIAKLSFWAKNRGVSRINLYKLIEFNKFVKNLKKICCIKIGVI